MKNLELEKAGKTEGLQDTRKVARGSALSVDQSKDVQRAKAGSTSSPRTGDVAGAGCPASQGIGLRGSCAEQDLGQRGGGEGRKQTPGKALWDWRRAGSPGPVP